MSLKLEAFSAVRWTTLASVGKSGLQFLQVIILARFLAPADFGLMATMIAILGFVQVFADMGLSNAIIHHQNISQEQLSSLYWLNLLTGIGVGLVLSVLSPWLAFWYGTSALQPMLMLMSLFFVFTAIGQQLRVLAEKQLRFAVLSKIELAASLSSFCTAVSLAWWGAGVWSLIFALLVSAAVNTIMAWWLLANQWRPLWCLKWGGIQNFLRFGFYMIGGNIMNALNSNLDVLLGGKFLGAHALGSYSLPRELSLRFAGVINPIITRVSLPMMAKNQERPELLRMVYLHTITMSTAINFPLYAAMAVMAPEVVFVFFGSQWGDAVPILQILALWGMFRSVINPIGSLIYAVGRADLSWKWNLVLFLFAFPVVWIGAHSGVIGLATTMLIFIIAIQFPTWYFLVRPLCAATCWDYFKPILKALFCSLLAAGVTSIFSPTSGSQFFSLMVGGLIGGVVYILSSWFFNKIFIKSILALLRQ